MTATEIAVIENPPVDAELVEPQTLSPKDAKALSKKIKAAVARVQNGFTTLDTNCETVAELLAQAEAGKIHVGLETTWSIWLADTVRLNIPDRFRRREFVKAFSDKGASQRAIAAALGVGIGTINRDLAATVPNGTVDTIDRNGKKHKRPSKPPEPQLPLDVKEVDPQPDADSKPEPKQPPITKEFRTEVGNLQVNVQAFRDLLDDERFGKARKRLADAHASEIQEAVTGLESILEALAADA